MTHGVRIVPISFGVAQSGPLNDLYLKFYSRVLTETCEAALPPEFGQDLTPVRVRRSDLLNPNQLHDTLQAHWCTWNWEQLTCVLVDMLMPEEARVPLRAANTFQFWNSLVEKLEQFPLLKLVVLTLDSPAPADQAIYRRIHEHGDRLIVVNDRGVSDCVSLNQTKFCLSLAAARRTQLGFATPADAIARTIVRRVGHFVEDPDPDLGRTARRCMDHWYDAKYSIPYLVEDVQSSLMEDPRLAPVVMFWTKDTEISDGFRLLWNRYLRQPADGLVVNVTFTGDAILFDQETVAIKDTLKGRQPLFIQSATQTHQTIAALLNKWPQDFAYPKFTCIYMGSERPDLNPESRTFRVNGHEVKYYVKEARRYWDAEHELCPYCSRISPDLRSPISSAEDPVTFSPDVFWQWVSMEPFIAERDVPHANRPFALPAVPNFSELIEQYGGWLALKVEKWLRNSFQQRVMTADILAICPKEKGAGLFLMNLNTRINTQILSIPRDIIDAVTALRKAGLDLSGTKFIERVITGLPRRSPSEAEHLSRLALARRELNAAWEMIADQQSGSVVLFDEFNVTGHTIRSLARLVSAFNPHPQILHAITIADFSKVSEAEPFDIKIDALYRLPLHFGVPHGEA